METDSEIYRKVDVYTERHVERQGVTQETDMVRHSEKRTERDRDIYR